MTSPAQATHIVNIPSTFLPIAFTGAGVFALVAVVNSSPPHSILEHIMLASSAQGVEALADLAFAQALRRGDALRVLGTGRLAFATDDAAVGAEAVIRARCRPSASALFPAAPVALVEHCLRVAFPHREVVVGASDAAPMSDEDATLALPVDE